jgi:hypothetical protein
VPPPGQQHLLALAVTQLSMHAFLAGTLLAAYLAAPVASIRPTLVNKRDLPNFQRDQQDATEQLIRADEVVRAHFVPPPHISPAVPGSSDHNWDRTHAMVAWAEGRPADPLATPLSSSDLLQNWRRKKQLKVLAQERTAILRVHRTNNIARIQDAIAQSTSEPSDTSAARVVKTSVGGYTEFRVSKGVAGRLAALATALVSHSGALSFLEKADDPLSTNDALPPSKDWIDYETIMSPKTNLETRLRMDYNMEPRERGLLASRTSRVRAMKTSLARAGVIDPRFLDTTKVTSGEIGTGRPVADTFGSDFHT